MSAQPYAVGVDPTTGEYWKQHIPGGSRVSATLADIAGVAPIKHGTFALNDEGLRVELWDLDSAKDLRDCYRTYVENLEAGNIGSLDLLADLCAAAYQRMSKARPDAPGVVVTRTAREVRRDQVTGKLLAEITPLCIEFSDVTTLDRPS
jgi:hypothetical protein